MRIPAQEAPLESIQPPTVLNRRRPPIRGTPPYPYSKKTTARNDLLQILHNGHGAVRLGDNPQLVASVRAVGAQEPEPDVKTPDCDE
jgi:hypothetical protein